MKTRDRLRNAIKAFSSSQLGNSVNGLVTRNNGSGYRFAPQDQVRGITYKAIDKIGASVSVYEPRVVRRNGDYYENHPLYALFNQPNTIQQSASDFVHLWAMLTEIYGETFWYLARGESSNKIKSIFLLNPAQIELSIYDGEVVGYILHKTNGDQVPFTTDELYHDKRPNPFNEYRGMSVLERASQYVDIELTTTSFTLNYMRNNASPSGIVSLPDMDRDTFKQFAAQWREGYEGPENAGKTAFVRGDNVDFKAVGATLKDVDQKITRQMAKEDVLMMLEVPKPLLGGTDDNGFGRANVDALTYIYAKEKIEPMMRRLDRIYQQIMQMQPRSVGVEQVGVTVTHESPVPEDKDFTHMENKDLVNIALTVNEVRERMGLPAIPGGDVLPTNAPAVETPTKSATRVTFKKKLTKAEMVKKEQADRESFRKKVEDTNTIYAKKVKSSIARFAGEQESLMIDKISAASKSYDEWLFSVDEESRKLAEILAPILVELMEVQAEDVSHFITGELLVVTDDMRKLVESNILEIAGVYNTDTTTAIQRTLAEGQTNGESLTKLKKRVESVYSDAKGYRAERIARTESARTGNRTAELTYKQNGYTEVEWFANPGACEFCKTLDGTTKVIGANYLGIGDVFTSNEGNKLRIEYANIDVPPIHPNCSCSIVPTGNRTQD